jgi:O-antigen ligase
MHAFSVFLGLVAGGGVWIGCFFFQRFPLAALGKAALVCLAGIPLLMLQLQGFLEAKVLLPKGAFWTLGERFRHWQEVVSHIAHHPFWGGGLGYSRTVSGMDNLEYPLMFPHNVPLEIWLDFGGVGIFLVLLGLWGMLERLARTPDRLFRATAGACATFVVVINQTSYSAFHTWWLSAVCLASFWVPFLIRDRQAPPPPSAPSCLT